MDILVECPPRCNHNSRHYYQVRDPALIVIGLILRNLFPGQSAGNILREDFIDGIVVGDDLLDVIEIAGIADRKLGDVVVVQSA